MNYQMIIKCTVLVFTFASFSLAVPKYGWPKISILKHLKAIVMITMLRIVTNLGGFILGRLRRRRVPKDGFCPRYMIFNDLLIIVVCIVDEFKMLRKD